jgi:pantoate--beta-alanine ligase
MAAGADIVFNPEVAEIYPPEASTAVEVTGEITHKLCGLSRPSHFKGVTTVVNILFNIVGPNRAYFGQKDAQQAIIIKKMVRELHMPLEIVVCPIVREADGLAMSSRNIYLSPAERQAALSLNRGLQKAQGYLDEGAEGCNMVAILTRIIKGEIAKEPLASIDYIEILDADTLADIEYIESDWKALAAVAVRFGKTRLIDNRILWFYPKGEVTCS